MLVRVCLGFALLVAIPSWSQVDSTNDTDAVAASDIQGDPYMAIPPLVGSAPYPNEVGAQKRSNYLSAGLILSAGYTDNVYSGNGTAPVSDLTYLVQPTILLDKTTPRLHQTFTYAPAFTFYQPTSSLNETDQNAAASLQYRLSPHVTVNGRDTFQISSTAFGQPILSSQGAVSGSVPSLTPGIVAPFAKRITNGLNIGFGWQFSLNDLIGTDGTLTELHYPNASQVPDFYDSSSRGGDFFYAHRLTGSQYMGATYDYSRVVVNPGNMQSETQVHSVLLFCTVYLKPTLTFTLAGGEQHYEISQFPVAGFASWTPSGSASIGWQRLHTNFAASYSRVVTAGGGLIGVFQSNTASASARWQVARSWTLGLSGSYSINTNITPLLPASTSGGHTVTGSASMNRAIGAHLELVFEYNWLQQSYDNIAAISNNPNSDRALVSLFYRFSKPLGQ
ncbi:MAG: hypothetical protein WA419_07550 [Silvibacterium sp.]